MVRAGVAVGVCVLAMLASMTLGCGAESRVAPAPFVTTLQPDDRIETLVVTLTVSDQGAGLDEPLALDLGLGYPLWLHPLGRGPDDVVPFGAVAQTSTAGKTLAPGAQATFTFGVDADAGQDALRTTSQLLADTTVGDVRRIGFASARSSDWILGDFEVRINGTPLHVDRAAAHAPDATQRALTDQIEQIDRQVKDLALQYKTLADPQGADAVAVKDLEAKAGPLLDSRTKLVAQSQVDDRLAGATREVDHARLAVLKTAAGSGSAPDEATRLEARLDGDRPWFVAKGFRPSWLPAGDAQTASVTLETRAHAGADTVNPVYARIGGRKYRLNAPYESLSASSGTQTYALDLEAGPLASTDLRDWALGMLGAHAAQETVPDRWHAQRLLVTVDDEVVYDSDADPRDRRSLDAIRLIPPAHRKADGALVANPRTVREVYLWEAGRGHGLDSTGTSAAPLPAAGDPAYPQPEAGLADDTGSGAGTYSEQGPGTGTWPDTTSPPFPGETTPWIGGGGGVGPGYGYGPGPSTGSGPWLQGGFQWGPGGGSLWGGLGGSGGGSLPWGSGPGGGSASGGASSGGKNGGSPGGSTTAGKPFQMKEVWISSGWKINEPFTVEWKVSGDTSGIRHFLVSLRVVRPDQSQGIFNDAAKKPVKVAVGQRSCTILVDSAFKPAQPYYYLAPCVTAVTKKGGKSSPQSHVRIGPARAVFPAIANAKIQPIPKDLTWKAGAPGSPSAAVPVAIGTAGKVVPPRTAWFVAGAQTPDAIEVGFAKPATHVALRPQANDTLSLRYEIPTFKGRQLLVGHVGFMGATLGADQVTVEMECRLIGQGKTFTYPDWKQAVSTNGSLRFLKQELDASDLGVPMSKAEIVFTFSGGGALDPKCTPGVYGLRAIAVSGLSKIPKTIRSDLAVDPTATWMVPGTIRDGIYTGSAKQLCLAVKNNGPEDVPASELRNVTVEWKYYVGQCGKTFSTKYGEVVTCGPTRVTDLRELSSGGRWKGPLKSGEVMRLVPTPSSGHARLGPDGILTSTKKLALKEANAWKLFSVWADVDTSLTMIKESNANNVWTHKYQPALVIGKGPLDYEVLLFDQTNYKGTAASYEFDPGTQRQRLVWHLGQMPGQPDRYQKVQSFRLGRKVNMRAAEENHFYTYSKWGDMWPGKADGGTGWAFRAEKVPKIGSLILYPKRFVEPIGAELSCQFDHYSWNGWVVKGFRYRDMFLALPEKPSDKVAKMPSLPEPIDDEIETVWVWRTKAMSGTWPKAWVKVTIFEDGNFGGDKATLQGPFAGGSPTGMYDLEDVGWDGDSGTGIDEEAGSAQAELKGTPGS